MRIISMYRWITFSAVRTSLKGSCLNGCDMLEIRRVMEPLYENGTRNFFIDEITAVTDFQKYGNVLSDYFSAKGAKVIIAGTDSLGIMLAESDILYDRIQMIHTSHVPYAEFSRLLGGKTLDDYIEYGGTLTKSPYKTLQASEEYQNTAIVGNILQRNNRIPICFHFPWYNFLSRRDWFGRGASPVPLWNWLYCSR